MLDPTANPSPGLLTDLYQINMVYAQFQAGRADRTAVFDLFYRVNPCGNGFGVAAGLQQAVEYVQSFSFTDDDIAYLRTVHPHDERFLAALRQLRFTGEMRAVPEGSVVFPNEPLVTVRARIFEAQLIETALLSIINHQTLIATKAARVVEAAHGKGVVEFGLRRAHGPQAGLYGARAAYIGGVAGTSNVLAGRAFGIPVSGTHAHSFVQSFASELEAFRVFADQFHTGCILLVDTYDTLASGLPNAIRVFDEMRKKLGSAFTRFGIRLDSGDLAYLSKECRRRLDEAGLKEALIVASSDLDEGLIRDLESQGARIDLWGVGTNLITSSGCAALGGVYKLVAFEDGGALVPRIKLSENPIKMTNPGEKRLVRFYDNATKHAALDLIMLKDEPAPAGEFTAFDPLFPWKRKLMRDYTTREMLVPIFDSGRLVYTPPALAETRDYARRERESLSPEVRRLLNPHEYHVDLSQPLWDLKQQLIQSARHVSQPGG